MSDSFESKVLSYCDIILKSDGEWDAKNRAVLSMTDLFRSYEGQHIDVINEVFTPEIFRSLKEPVAHLVSEYTFIRDFFFLFSKNFRYHRLLI
jgi:hypothetical protein